LRAGRGVATVAFAGADPPVAPGVSAAGFILKALGVPTTAWVAGVKPEDAGHRFIAANLSDG
jgi:hypothetical protein